MFHFSETDIREQKKYEMRAQTSADNTVNDLSYEIKFENCVNDKIIFLLSETLLFFLEQLCFANFKDASEENLANEFMLDMSLRSSSVGI